MGEFQIIVLYLLSLAVTFSIATLLRLHLDASDRRKTNKNKEDKSDEILEEVNIRDSGCNIDKVIKKLEAEDMDISPNYRF